MKERAIVLVDADGDSLGSVLEAAARCGYATWIVRDCCGAWNLLRSGGEGVAGLVVDLDPGAHGLALLEAAEGLTSKPPVIALTGLEESEMKPVVEKHGAADCIGKPFTIARLQGAIERLTGRVGKAASCDLWGHPFPARRSLEAAT